MSKIFPTTGPAKSLFDSTRALTLATLGAGLTLNAVSPNTYRRLLAEDGVVETLTVGFLVAAAAAMGHTALRRRSFGPALIAVLLALAAMEEISWGQRIFGWTTPVWFSRLSSQPETNFHNYAQHQIGLLTRHLVAMVLATWGVALPLWAARARTFKEHTRLWLPPLELAPTFLVATALCLDWPTGLEEELGEFLGAAALAATCASRGLDPTHLEKLLATARRASWPLALATTVGFAAWSSRGIWVEGIPTSYDGPRHLLRSEVMASVFLPKGHVSGWSPYWYLGAELFLFQSYGYFALIGAAIAAAPWASSLVIFKGFYLLPFVGLPLAVGYLARSSGVSRFGSAAAAFASIAVGTPTGFGAAGLFGTGLLLQAVGVLAIALVWPTLRQGIERGDRRSLILAASGLGALLVTHFLSGVYLAGIAALFTVFNLRVIPRASLHFLTVAALALGLASHALFPALELRSLMGPSPGWGSTGALAELASGEMFGSRAWSLAALAGLVLAAASGPPRLRFLAVAAVCTLVVSLIPAKELEWLPRALAIPVDLLSPRGQGYVALFVCVLGGHALSSVHAGLSSRGRWGQGVGVLLVGVVFAALVADTASVRGLARTQGHLPSSRTADYRATMEWLADHASPPAIVAFEPRVFSKQESGSIRLSSLLNLETGLFSLAGDQMELGRTRHHQTMGLSQIRSLPPERLKARLLRRGVTFLIVKSPEAKKRLAEADGIRVVFRTGNITVLRIEEEQKWMLETSALRVLDWDFATERLRWTTENTSAKPVRTSVPINAHPNWTLTVGGKAASLETAEDGLIEFVVPTGTQKIELAYQRRFSERLYGLLTLITALGCLVGLSRAGREVSPD